MAAATPRRPLKEAPRDTSAILAQQTSLMLPRFTSNDAFTLGGALRTRIQSLYPNPATAPTAAISITTANSDTLLFHATTGPNINPDNDIWIARKRATVKRWGVPSWYMSRRFVGDEVEFARKYTLGNEAGRYAIHGGGVPVRVEGVEGVVAVVVVSGLKQEEDHMVVVEGLEGLKVEMEGGRLMVDGRRIEGRVLEYRVKWREQSGDNDGASGVGEGEAKTKDGQAMVDESKAGGAVLAS